MPRTYPQHRAWLLVLLVTAAVALAGCGSGVRSPDDAGSSPPPAPLRGITVDAVEDLDAVVAAVEQLDTKPTVRIVFDLAQQPEHYEAAIDALRPHAYLMAELVDSSELASVSEGEMRDRTEAYVEAFASQVDIWEIGNELNGAWVGAGPDEINAKVLAAYDVVRENGGRTAITLNYWSGPGCYTHDWEATVGYAESMPQELREVDYVLLSVYETVCAPPQQPTAAQLAQTLTDLGKLFPDASLGIGEVGAQGRSDGLPADPDLATKQQLAQRYYGMHDELQDAVGERYVGGYFWWYFVEDAVPKDRPDSLWPTINDLVAGL